MVHFFLKTVAKKQLFLSLLLYLSGLQLYAQPSYENYELVWSDEFDEDGLPNPANWGYEKGCSVRNNELQYYAEARERNSRIEDGFLIIEAHRESMGGCDYTAVSLVTWGKREFQYGIFEMRAKIDVRKGSWPAFWTLGVSEEWPSNGEVDIMEYYNNALHANVAWGTDTRWEAKWDSETKPVNSAFAEEFHIWRMLWTEDVIELWVDDFLQNTTDLSTTINGSLATLRNPFHQKAAILVNQAVGSNGGDPSDTDFPIRYIVDYVRVYQEGSDTTPPHVTSVKGSAGGTILVFFSENVDKSSAETLANYSIASDTVTLTNAQLQSDKRTVAITATGLSVGDKHTITVQNINDDALPANTMAASTHECTVTPESKKLTGTIIGNGDPWNGRNDIGYEKALDGSTATYADCVDSPLWVGYDFGEGAQMVITEISYFPRDGYAERMNGRYFEISNDGETWKKLYTIPSIPPEGTFTTALIDDAPPVRFIRYNGSTQNLNVAEIEFWGYAISTGIIHKGKDVYHLQNGSFLQPPLQLTYHTLDGKVLDRQTVDAAPSRLASILRKGNNPSIKTASGVAVVTIEDACNRKIRLKTVVER